MTYRPTPKGLRRDIVTLSMVLAVALRNMDRLNYTKANEETSTGSCWLPEEQRVDGSS